MRLSLRRCHPLDFLHASARRASAIAKTLDLPRDYARQLAYQPCHNPHRIPEQSIVGWMVNVGLNHSGVDPQLTTVFQSHGYRRRYQQLVHQS
jgi:hypothetical protein